MKNSIIQCIRTFLLIGLFICIPAVSFAQDEPPSAEELAKKLQNPVASLISVPFQANFDFGIGPADGSRFLLNVQPVIPMSLNEDWNLIARAILPIVSQNDVFGFSGAQSGLGDAVVSGFFSPKEPTAGGLIWGVGPVLLVPTATDELLGTNKFGAGPTAVFLKQMGQITAGLLANHIWSIAGDDARPDVNATFIQPFIAKNFAGGYALTLNTEFTQSWDQDASSGYLHLMGSKVISLGDQLAQVVVGPRIPYGGANTTGWGFRAAFVLLFPK